MNSRMKFLVMVNILFFIFKLFSSNIYASDLVRLAVLDFQSNGASKFASKAVSEYISTELAKRREFTVIERSQIGEILKEQGFQQIGCTEQECAVEVGKLLSVRKIVIGTLSKTGRTYIITVKIVNVESGKIDFAESEVCSSEDDIIQSAKIVSDNLYLKMVGVDRPASEVITSQSNERLPFSIGVAYRYGELNNVNIPKLEAGENSIIMGSGKIKKMKIHSIILSPSYEFTKYFTLKTEFKISNSDESTIIQDETTDENYNVFDFESKMKGGFRGYGFAVEPSFTYFKKRVGFFLSPGLGFDIFKIDSPLTDIYYSYFLSIDSPSVFIIQPQYDLECTANVSETVYSPLLKIQFGILYNLHQSFDVFIACGIDYHIYTELFSDVKLKEDWSNQQGDVPFYFSNIDTKEFKGNFPPEYYFQAGVNLRLF